MSHVREYHAGMILMDLTNEYHERRAKAEANGVLCGVQGSRVDFQSIMLVWCSSKEEQHYG